MKPITKAVIPAAGLGTRFLPATKACPKEMLPIVDKPTIQYIIEEAIASGIEDIIIVTGKTKRAIEDHFDKNFELDYKNPEQLRKFINDKGKILPRRTTGACAKHQRDITTAVKRARHIAILPYAQN